ncbi:MAG TPA: methylated-DNA--[protein]-cysteine S-methyltransferase [Ferrovibrio sp.]|jgi:methylated-DNA-[protein]-cysteine S-methyltransferase|uniref:methylated-DNA--[protein]-cysteine S-methyltransferase n=1 Tax=Ferrovibrio sp. TaxID=1917215 RepID=UPI002ED19CA3
MANAAEISWIVVPSPLGPLTVTAKPEAITAVDWGGRPGGGRAMPVLAEAERQLAAYFAKKLDRFDLPLQPAGSDFQKAVWDFMLAIPMGETRTYGEAAAATNAPARAVGGACGANPIPVIIPCHRILAAGGEVGGYSGMGGLATKRWLLRHEGAFVPPEQVSLFAAGLR